MKTLNTKSKLVALATSRFLRSATIVVLALLFGAARSSDARAAQFYAVIENLNGVQHPTAQIDVSVDTLFGTGLQVVFSVFRASDGAELSNFVLYTNENGFCSSSSASAPNDNLFTASGGLPALVRVITPANAPTSTAVVRQDLGGSKIVFGMPPTRRSDWRHTGRGGDAHDHSSWGPCERDISAHRQRLVITGRSECFRRE